MSITAMTQISENEYRHTVVRSSTPESDDKGEVSVSVSFVPYIFTLPEDSPYTLRQPISIRVERQEDQEWIARFEDAHISMSGSDPEEAMQLLAEDIAGAFTSFLAEEETLSSRLKRDLAVLRQYIRKR